MDLLKPENGFSLIETLVTIVLLGLAAVFVSSFFDQIFRNPQLFIRQKALYLARQEIINSVNNKRLNDTIYTNPENNMTIERKVIHGERFYRINIYAVKNGDKIILTLSRIVRK